MVISEPSPAGINGSEILHDWNQLESTNEFFMFYLESFAFMVAALKGGRLVIGGASRNAAAQKLIMLSCSSAIATRLKSSFPAPGGGDMPVGCWLELTSNRGC